MLWLLLLADWLLAHWHTGHITSAAFPPFGSSVPYYRTVGLNESNHSVRWHSLHRHLLLWFVSCRTFCSIPYTRGCEAMASEIENWRLFFVTMFYWEYALRTEKQFSSPKFAIPTLLSVYPVKASPEIGCSLKHARSNSIFFTVEVLGSNSTGNEAGLASGWYSTWSLEMAWLPSPEPAGSFRHRSAKCIRNKASQVGLVSLATQHRENVTT